MPYTRPPTILQQCGKYTKIATLWLVDRGVDFVKDQAGVFYKTPQEYSDESWKRRNFQTTGIKVFRGAYTGLREERKKLWDPSWVGRQVRKYVYPISDFIANVVCSGSAPFTRRGNISRKLVR